MAKLSIALLLLSSVVMVNGAYADAERFNQSGTARPGTLEGFARQPAQSLDQTWDIGNVGSGPDRAQRSARAHGAGIAQNAVNLKVFNLTGQGAWSFQAQMRRAPQNTYRIARTDSFDAVQRRLAGMYGVSADRVLLYSPDGTRIRDNTSWSTPVVANPEALAKMAKGQQPIASVRIAVRILPKK